MQDKCYIGFSPLAYLSTSPEGIINKADGKFVLNEKKWEAICWQMANAGANMMRLLSFGVWDCGGADNIYTPYRYAGGNKWDLSILEENYFVILRKVCQIMNKYGLVLWFDMFDHCQNKYYLSPHTNNVNGVHELYDPTHYQLARIWMDHVRNILKDFPKTIYGCGNEMDMRGVNLCVEVIYPKLKNWGVPVHLIAYGAQMELGEHHSLKVLDNMKKQAKAFWGNDRRYIMRPVHNILSTREVCPERPFGDFVHYALYWWGDFELRIALSDDGTFEGDSECDVITYDGRTQRRPSAESWGRLLIYAMQNYNSHVGGYPKFVFEHCPKTLNMDCHEATLKRMSEAYQMVYGSYPSNFNKYPKPGDIDWDNVLKPKKKKKTGSDIYWWIAGGIALIFLVILLAC